MDHGRWRTTATLAASLFILVFSADADVPSELFVPSALHSDRVVVQRYQPVDTTTVPISKLELLVPVARTHDELPPALHWYSAQQPDFNLILLRDGLAKLRVPNEAPQEYRDAEANAKATRTGAWDRILPRPAVPVAQQPEIAVEDDKQVGRILRSLWVALTTWVLPLGIVSAVSAFLYRKLYIQRRPRLLVIGEASAGKTAFSERLLDPAVDAARLLGLTQTVRMERRKKKRHIVHGRFELYPVVSDVPGPAVGTVWDELSRKWLRPAHALVLVLAHARGNTVAADTTDDKYLYTQLGYTQAFLGGVLGARRAHKPRTVVIFLNKFDLISSHSPTDAAAAPEKMRLENIFAEHTQTVQLACKKANVPFHLVVGSAVAGWNTQRVVELVGDALYG